MKMNPENLFKPMVKTMNPYAPIEPPDQIAARLGLDEDTLIKLDANENPYGVPEFVLKELSVARYLNIYPDPAQKVLRESISGYAGCKPEQIVAGAGADELIDLLCRSFLEPGDRVLTFEPTFSYYGHVVELNGGILDRAQRTEDFGIDIKRLADVNLDRVKMVFLCSPNNPTGNLLEKEVLEFFLEKELIVVVDEAYYEFSNQTYADWIHNYKNLVVLRTFSKCFALAGLRVGYGIMSEIIADALMKIKPPYSVTVASEQALKVCLGNLNYFQEQVQEMIHTRKKAIDRMNAWKQVKVFPSNSNFILVRLLTKSAAEVRESLEKKGVLVRYYKSARIKDCLRLSIGTPEQMEKLLDELELQL